MNGHTVYYIDYVLDRMLITTNYLTKPIEELLSKFSCDRAQAEHKLSSGYLQVRNFIRTVKYYTPVEPELVKKKEQVIANMKIFMTNYEHYQEYKSTEVENEKTP